MLEEAERISLFNLNTQNINRQLRYTYKRIYCVAFHGFEPLIIAVIEHLASKGCRLNDFSCLTLFPDDRCLSEQGIVAC